MPLKVERNVRRTQVWARVFLHGPSGSGKTRGALELGSRLFDGSLPIALINTEPNRGKLYADRFALEALVDIEADYHPERFIEALDVVEKIVPGGVCILDSATHEWYGTNGVNQLASRFGDWAKARPLHQRFVDRLQTAEMHVIVCCRSKMKYEQAEVEENGRKKTVIVALGVGPMQDADFQYEFSLAGAFDRGTHDVEWTGHIDELEGTSTNLVADEGETARVLTGWLSEGDPVEPAVEASEENIALLRASLEEEGYSADRIDRGFAAAASENRGKLHPDYVAEKLAQSMERLAKKVAAKAKAEAEAAAKAKAEAESAPEPAAA